MPDYGWFYYILFAYDSISYTSCLKINGHIIFSSAGSNSRSPDANTGVIPVKKGDIVTVKSYYPTNTDYNGGNYTVDGCGLTQLIFFKNKS